MPVIGVSGLGQKTELYEYGYQSNEKKTEIQGHDHYWVGKKNYMFNEKQKVQVQKKKWRVEETDKDK